MVQFKGRNSEANRNGYWKLERPPLRQTRSKRLIDQLSGRGYRVKSSANKDRLLDLTTRCERGFPSYDKYSAKELKGFCEQRQLQIGATTKKDDFVRILEPADDSATFDRFLDLPAELRNTIYALQFETFGAIERPAEPPITQVSRQLRQESLGLFHRTCVTLVEIRTTYLDYHGFARSHFI